VTSLFRSLARSNPPISLNDLLQSFQFGGLNYPLQMGGTPGQKGEDIQSSFQGYVQGAYQRNGVVFACQVAHFAPIPDPSATFRGMSWLTPIIREIQADSAATVHKQMFFENGATPNMIVSFDREMRPEQVRRFKELFDEGHSGLANAYERCSLAVARTRRSWGPI
jgi:hypothetical protein